MRRVNPFTDITPGEHHKFEAGLVKQFVKGKFLLDIGCWTGQFISLIQNNAFCTGIEPDAGSVKFANKTRKAKFLVGSALKLPFKNNSFDIVTMWDVIEHLPKKTEDIAIKEVTRVLRKKGWFALSTVTTHPVAVLLDPAFFLIGHRHYSTPFLKNLLEDNNLKIKKIIYTGGMWTLIRDNINLLSKYIFGKTIFLKNLDLLANSEYTKSGFVQVHILAQKQ